MTFKVETDVPIPQGISSRGAASRYPLKEMKVGNSFFVPVTDVQKQKNLRSSFASRAKKLGIKVVSMADETGVRCWRTM